MNNTSRNSISSWLLGLCLSSTLLSVAAQAEPVWHCSRTGVQVADAGDNFTLAALDAEREVMRISLRDLYSAYQGHTVKASGLTVSACLMAGNHPTTQAAMQSIGADARVLEKMSRKSALVQSHVFVVQNEQDMQACMSKHYPAIGYLPQATHTEAIGPCF
jgi:hypothetical protein